jgi:hypothetical protein
LFFLQLFGVFLLPLIVSLFMPGWRSLGIWTGLCVAGLGVAFFVFRGDSRDWSAFLYLMLIGGALFGLFIGAGVRAILMAARDSR